MTGKSLNAVRGCAEWLEACLALGWRKADLDFLEALWWKYHDDNGQLVQPSIAPPQKQSPPQDLTQAIGGSLTITLCPAPPQEPEKG